MSLTLRGMQFSLPAEPAGIGASYYVDTTGNDSTGTGSLAAPWATLSKALATVPAGSTVWIAAGTYAENTGATGRFQITASFAQSVTLTTLTGGQDVTITGASDATIETILQSNARNITFRNLKFAMRANTTGYAIRLAACNNIQFVNCVFTVSTNSGSTKAAVQLQPSGAATIAAIFSSCTFACNGTDPARGASVVWTAGNTINIRFTLCTALTTSDCIYCNGGTIVVSGGRYQSGANHALIFGADSNTGGNATTAVVTDAVVISNLLGHALLFGNGCTGCEASGNTITGGDYALVLKEHTGSHVHDNTLIAGTVAAVYFKASVAGRVTNNVINSAQAGALICRVAVGDTGNLNSTITFTNNTAVLSSSASVFAWGDSSADAGGGVCDYNTYNLQATSGNLGTVRAASNIANLAALQAAWSGYDVSGNDTHSTVLT